jgi:hypothetical protein
MACLEFSRFLAVGGLELKGGIQTQSRYQPVRLDRDVAKTQKWVQWTRASHSISAALPGPMFLPPVPRNPPPPLRGPFPRLACGRSQRTSVFVGLDKI